jgi:hypothetical protein
VIRLVEKDKSKIIYCIEHKRGKCSRASFKFRHDAPADTAERKNNKRKKSQIESAPAPDAEQTKKAKVDSAQCNMKADSFQGAAAVANGPYLDVHWKCRVCGLLPGAHTRH